MELTCSKEQLQKSVQLAEKHTNKQSSIPTLSGVLLETGKNILLIRSTDLYSGFETKITAQIKKDGYVVVPARPIVSLLSSLNDETIELESRSGSIHIATKNTATTVKTFDPEDFPKLPKIKSGHKVSFKTGDLLANLKGVYFAASDSDVKPEIASVFFKGGSESGVKTAATDSFRLAEKSFKSPLPNTASFLFPARSVADFVKIIEGFDGEVEFSFDSQHLLVSHPLFSYFTRLIDGNFPDYEQIIPGSFSTEASLDKKSLAESLKLAGVFSGRLREVKMRAYPDDNLLEISTSDSELGEHSSRLPAQITGESIEISFNQRYLLEGLEPVSSSGVILRFSGPNKPLLIQSPEDVSYVYLVMPMKSA